MIVGKATSLQKEKIHLSECEPGFLWGFIPLSTVLAYKSGFFWGLILRSASLDHYSANSGVVSSDVLYSKGVHQYSVVVWGFCLKRDKSQQARAWWDKTVERDMERSLEKLLLVFIHEKALHCRPICKLLQFKEDQLKILMELNQPFYQVTVIARTENIVKDQKLKQSAGVFERKERNIKQSIEWQARKSY